MGGLALKIIINFKIIINLSQRIPPNVKFDEIIIYGNLTERPLNALRIFEIVLIPEEVNPIYAVNLDNFDAIYDNDISTGSNIVLDPDQRKYYEIHWKMDRQNVRSMLFFINCGSIYSEWCNNVHVKVKFSDVNGTVGEIVFDEKFTRDIAIVSCLVCVYVFVYCGVGVI